MKASASRTCICTFIFLLFVFAFIVQADSQSLLLTQSSESPRLREPPELADREQRCDFLLKSFTAVRSLRSCADIWLFRPKVHQRGPHT